MPLFSDPAPRVFSIPPGVPFARALARGVLARARAAGMGPEALADLEIIASGAAARALQAAFAQAAGGASLGPRLTTLGALGEQTAFAGAAPKPVSGAERLLSLASLARRLLVQAPELGAPVSAAGLAGDLATLLDEAQEAGVDLGRLEALLEEAGAERWRDHWAPSRRFLDLVRRDWPELLAALGRSDAAARNRQAMQALAAQWAETPPERAVLAVGVGASLEASAELMARVCRLPQGAVVLPGLDAETDDQEAAALVAGRAPEHPQAALFRLLERMGVDRRAVRDWSEDGRPDAPARLRLLRRALRSAPTTDAWSREAGEIAAEAPAATAKLSLIEAPSARAEALALAVAMREALETPGRRVALVTPDSALARRVAAELGRWNVTPGGAAGEALSASAPGVFLLELAQAALTDLSPTPLLSLLKHPLCALGGPRGPLSQTARRFEREVLRHERPGAGVANIVTAIRKRERERAEAGAPPPQPTLEEWFEGVAARLSPLLERMAAPEAPFDALLQTHIEVAEALSRAEDDAPPLLYRDAAGESLAGFLTRLRGWAPRFGEIAPAEYPALLSRLLGGETVRDARGRHPRALILDPSEARLRSADLVLLAGLNEGVWPRPPSPDAWIGRDLRAALGLPPLEARIGRAAHDFVQAAMADEVILSRARKADGSPTVASRWLLRLETLLTGAAKDALEAMRGRGRRWLALAELLDRAPPAAPAPRPRPTPPVSARPTQFSVTEIETLIRDPYAVYAKKVLRLRPMQELDETPDARDRGDILHGIVERFVRRTMAGMPAPEDAVALFDGLADEALSPIAPWPTLHAVWRARAARVRDWFLASEAKRRETGRPVALESRGELALDTPVGAARLTAFADRIDLISGEGYAIYDYKTGAPPTPDQVAQFAKQLPLEAAILGRAGFRGAPAQPVARLGYLRLSGGAAGGEEKLLPGEASALAEEALGGLRNLLIAYADAEQPYLSRARPAFLKYEGDYDHLARLGEWEDGA